MKKLRNWLIAIGFIGVASAAVIGTQVKTDQIPIIDINPYKENLVEYSIVSGEKETVISKTKPKVTFKSWNGEASLGFSYDKLNVTGSRNSEKIEWKGAKEEVHAYSLDEENFEVEIVLLEKPVKNTFDFTVEGAENFDFFYQAPLTQKQIDDGDVMPENVVGSYAVYHKTKRGNSYGTGKVLHIYRPKAIDANGAEVWGELIYNSGNLRVIIPQSFLSSASYPVRVDPTFGKTDDGASSTAASADNKLTSRATPSTSGTVSSLTCRLWLSSAGTANWRGVIYSSTSDSPDDLLAVTDDSTFTSTSETAQTANFTGANLISIVASTQYWIGFHVQDPGTPSWTVSRDNTAGQRITNGDDVWTGGTDDPHSADKTSLSGPIDCYVTYTEPSTGTKGFIMIPKLK